MSGPALDEALWGEGPLAKTLVPDATVLHLDELFAEGDIVTLVVTASSATAGCPVCGQCATRVHSRYNRAVADRPWQGLAVRIHLQTRRWCCPTPSCERRICAERLPAVVAPYARRTRRLAGVVEGYCQLERAAWRGDRPRTRLPRGNVRIRRQWPRR